MPTVIDSLIVTLGLDPSNFNKGEKEAARAFLATREQFRKTGKEVETSAKSADVFLGKLQTRALAMFAVFAGGKGVKDFAQYINSTNASVGRTAMLFGGSTKEVSTWMGMIQAAGGSGEGAAASILSLNNELQQMGLTGDSRILPYLRSLGVSIQGANGQIVSATELLPRLATALGSMQDKARATAIGRGLGLSDDMLVVMLQGREAMERYMKDQQRWGVVTEEQARHSRELHYSMTGMTRSFESLGREVMDHLNPGMASFNRKLEDLFVYAREHKWVDAFFTPFDAGMKVAESELARFWKLISNPPPMTDARKKLLERGAAKDKLSTPEQEKAANVLEELFFWAVGRENKLAEANEEFAKILDKDRKARVEMDDHRTKEDRSTTSMLAVPLRRLVAWLTGEDYKPPEQQGSGAPGGGLGPGGALDLGGALAGGGLSGLASKEEKRKQAADDVAYFESQGWTRKQAIGIVAGSILGESEGDPKAVGDNGQAYGLAQWHPDRQARFASVFGHDIRQSTRDEQRAFINWELRNSERAAGDVLARTQSSPQSAYVMTKLFERPLNAQKDARDRAVRARELEAQINADEAARRKVDPLAGAVNSSVPSVPSYGAPTAAQWAAGSTSNDNSRSSTTTINGGVNVTVPPGTTDPRAIGDGIKKSLSDDSLAMHGEYGYM
jgi:hypothetical protein